MKEIECRFLEIDKDALIEKLIKLGAKDRGEVMLEETIIYDKEGKWKDENRFIRLRKSGNTIKLSYKEHREHTVDGTFEIDFGIDDYKKAGMLFESLGFKIFRHQQKKRHTFELNGVTIDIDTWPKIPTYVEFEGESEADLKKVVRAVGYDWKDVRFENAGWIMDKIYNIKLHHLKSFTFDKVE